MMDFKSPDGISKDLGNHSLKLEIFKRKFGVFSKSIGTAYIPFKNLEGSNSYEGKVETSYKEDAMFIHV